MRHTTNRRSFLGAVAGTVPTLALSAAAEAQQRRPEGVALPGELAAFDRLSVVLGRATDRSVTASVLAKERGEGFLEFGTRSGNYERQTGRLEFPAGAPVEVILDPLLANTRYFYRLHYRRAGERTYAERAEG